MHPFFAVLDARVIGVPNAQKAARLAFAHFYAKGRKVTVTKQLDGRFHVAPVGLQPLLFVTDPAATWDTVSLL